MKWTLLAFAATLAASVALVFGPSVAAGGTFNCTTATPPPSTVNGNLTAGPGCTLNGTHVKGNVNVSSGGSLTANGATIDGNVEIAGTSGSNSICGTTIGGNLQVHNNTGSTTIDGGSCSPYQNTVGGNLEIHNNTGGPVSVSDTTVNGNLDCHNDSPGATAGSGNHVNGKTKGECTTSSTTPCPSGGCVGTASNDDTSVVVTVPGGGKSGNLTITLSPPPTDDGCGQESDAIGSIVTVVPPGGYTAANPIVVSITYSGEVFVSAVCKSKNSSPPFTALPECNFPEESPPPDNVPCWTGGEGGATVYITSTDPGILGH
jgi:hypothetical protein